MSLNKLLRYILGIVAIFIIHSCGTKTAETSHGRIEVISPEKILEKYSSVYTTPNYMSATLNVKVKSKDSKNSFTAYLRLEQDKKIWINISFLGISFARGVITPDSLRMYERQNKTTFTGDFEYISKLLGTDLDFYQLQALFLGQPMEAIESKKYKTLVSKDSYLLEYNHNRKLSRKGVNTGDYIKRYWYNPQSFELERQVISLPDRRSTLMVENKEYELVEDKYLLPKNISLQIISTSVTTVEINYKGVKVDKKLTFPFRIPEGYKKLQLN